MDDFATDWIANAVEDAYFVLIFDISQSPDRLWNDVFYHTQYLCVIDAFDILFAIQFLHFLAIASYCVKNIVHLSILSAVRRCCVSHQKMYLCEPKSSLGPSQIPIGSSGEVGPNGPFIKLRARNEAL